MSVVFWLGMAALLYVCCKGAVWTVYNFVANLCHKRLKLLSTIERLALCYVAWKFIPAGWLQMNRDILRMDSTYTALEYIEIAGWVVAIAVILYVFIKEIKDLAGFRRGEWCWDEPEFTLFGRIGWIGSGSLLVWVMLLPFKVVFGIGKVLCSETNVPKKSEWDYWAEAAWYDQQREYFKKTYSQNR